MYNGRQISMEFVSSKKYHGTLLLVCIYCSSIAFRHAIYTMSMTLDLQCDDLAVMLQKRSQNNDTPTIIIPNKDKKVFNVTITD